MFCRVCGFRVRVWESYGTPRSFGYGYGSLTEPTEVPGIVARAYVQNSQKFRAGTAHAVPVPRVLWHGSYRTHRSSGHCGTGVQNLQKLRVGIENAVPVPQVFVVLAYGTYRSPGYGYECPAELIEVPGTGETQENTRPRGRILI